MYTDIVGSISGRVIPKTQKWYLVPPCLTLSNIRYVLRVKWSNPGKGVAPSPIPRCSSYWKGSLLVALDYGRLLYLFYLLTYWIGLTSIWPINLSITVHVFPSCILMSFSIDETQLLRYGNLSTSFRLPPFSVEMFPFWLKPKYSVLSAFTWRLMPPVACFRLFIRDSAWLGVFARSALPSA